MCQHLNLRNQFFVGELLIAVKDVTGGSQVRFPEHHIPLRALYLLFFDSNLSRIILLQFCGAVLAISQILLRGSQLGLPSPDFVRAQHEQFRPRRHVLTFSHFNGLHEGQQR